MRRTTVVGCIEALTLAACTSPDPSSGERTYTRAQVQRLEQDARKAGYAAGVRDERKKLESVLDRAYADGLRRRATSCLELDG
jgi:hypothetical protein